jgi:hypothetical protein
MTSRPLLAAALLLLSAPLVYAQDSQDCTTEWNSTTANEVPLCNNVGATFEGHPLFVPTTQTPTTFTSYCTGVVTKFVIHSGHQTVTVTCGAAPLSVTESKTP